MPHSSACTVALLIATLLAGCINTAQERIEVPQPGRPEQIMPLPEAEPDEQASPGVFQKDASIRVLAPAGSPTADSVPVEAPLPAQRNDLTDPRLLAAARMVGAKPPAKEPRKEEPPLPPKASASVPNLAESIPPEATPAPEPRALAAQQDAPKAPVVNKAPVKPLAPEPPAKGSETAQVARTPPAPPPRRVARVTATEVNMVNYYKRQLARENLAPEIRTYYQRKLREAESASQE